MERLTVLLFLFLSIFAWNRCSDDGDNASEEQSDDSQANTDPANTGDEDAHTGDILERFDSERLFANLETLAADEMKGRDEGTPESQAAREHIIGQLQSCNVGPLDPQTYEQTIDGTPCVNLLARIEGKDPTLNHRNVLISAHYDHIGASGNQIYNGAYDNAAAVAAVIESACVLAETPPSRSVVFGFWDCEEPPSFLTDKMGSEYFAENPTIDLDTVDLAIVLDLWGSALWPGFNGLFILGAEASDAVKDTVFGLQTDLDDLAVNVMSLHLVENQPMGHQPWSDYDGFRNRKVPFLFLSDGQNKHYHQPTDDMTNIVESKLIDESQYLLALINEFGMKEETPSWQGHPHLGAHDLSVIVEFTRVVMGETEIPSIIDALKLSANTVKKMNNDVAALNKIHVKSDAEITEQHLRLMRRVTQRLMCLAGSTYPEIICSAL